MSATSATSSTPQILVTLSPEDWVLVTQCLGELKSKLESKVPPSRSESWKAVEERLVQDIKRVADSISLAGFHSLSAYDEEHNTGHFEGAMILDGIVERHIGRALSSRSWLYRMEGQLDILTRLEELLPELSSQNDWEGLRQLIKIRKALANKPDLFV
jgi:hypothetical protein